MYNIQVLDDMGEDYDAAVTRGNLNPPEQVTLEVKDLLGMQAESEYPEGPEFMSSFADALLKFKRSSIPSAPRSKVKQGSTLKVSV